MVDGLDVVAVGVADEGAEVAGVVLGPYPWRVQHLGPLRDRRVAERLHRVAVGRAERDVGLLADVAVRLLRADPEVGNPVP